MLGRDARDRRVIKDPAIQVLHYLHAVSQQSLFCKWAIVTHVECASENCRILAQTVDLWGRNIASGEGAENAVLALNLVRSLGEQLAGWLLAQDVLRAGGRGEEVGRVRLAVAELLHGEWESDAGDSGREVILQQGEADWVADWAGHGDEGAVLEWRELSGFVVGGASGTCGTCRGTQGRV